MHLTSQSLLGLAPWLSDDWIKRLREAYPPLIQQYLPPSIRPPPCPFFYSMLLASVALATVGCCLIPVLCLYKRLATSSPICLQPTCVIPGSMMSPGIIQARHLPPPQNMTQFIPVQA